MSAFLHYLTVILVVLIIMGGIAAMFVSHEYFFSMTVQTCVDKGGQWVKDSCFPAGKIGP